MPNDNNVVEVYDVDSLYAQPSPYLCGTSLMSERMLLESRNNVQSATPLLHFSPTTRNRNITISTLRTRIQQLQRRPNPKTPRRLGRVLMIVNSSKL